MSRCFVRVALYALVLGLVAPSARGQGCVGDVTGNGIVNGADLGQLLSYWGPRTVDPASIAADLDGNGVIDGADLGLLLSGWGTCGTHCPGDINRDGYVDGADIGLLLSNWG